MVAIPDYSAPPERRNLKWRFNRLLERYLPKRLYPRTLIIVITPVVVLLSIVMFIFMERHWDKVTGRMSRAVAQEIAFLIKLHESLPPGEDSDRWLVNTANEHLGLGFTMIKGQDLPPPARKPLFSLLDIKLSKQISKRVGKPFWIDTLGRTGYVDIRVKVRDGLIFRFLTEQERAYASNSHIFILWMVVSSVVLLSVAVIFMRNQIRPILALASAAQSFGLGRDVPDFRPRGAAEVRAAAVAFLNMKERIGRHVEQRTTMLAGVSHDLRTILTRFKLQLEVLGDGPQVQALKSDVDEMQHMLEDYIDFVRGHEGEKSVETDIGALLHQVARETRHGHTCAQLVATEGITALIRPNAFKRCISNLVGNACRHGSEVIIGARCENGELTVTVEDDGPGIPEEMRSEVFRPFCRLDGARNQDEGGSGLGLTIALDIARSHGGDITLDTSTLGGLKAVVRVPIVEALDGDAREDARAG